MKLYQFFRKDDEVIKTGDSLYDKYPLYAVTMNKNIAILFEASHDMNKFIKKVFKGDDEECVNYLNRHHGNILDWYELDTYKKGSLHPFEKINIDVLMTDLEYSMISFSVENHTILEELDFSISPRIFTSKIVDALSGIGYTTIYHLLNGDGDDYDYAEYRVDISYDELLLYLNTHKDILRYEKVDLIIS